MQVSSLTSAFSVTLIASTGHADAQAAQPVHVALSTFTAIMVTSLHPDTGFPIYLFPLRKNTNRRRIVE
jgi:ribonuclease BN (tRNA processing enzyme)